VPPALAAGGHGARDACHGRTRRVREREGGGVDGLGQLRPVGHMGGARPNKVKRVFFQFLFSNKFQTTVSNHILSRKKTFSRNGPKIKVA
jgi:hypothetical protein